MAVKLSPATSTNGSVNSGRNQKMDPFMAERARDFAAEVNRAGENCRVIVIKGNVVMRLPCPTSNTSATPTYKESTMVNYNEYDLNNAFELGLIMRDKMRSSNTSNGLGWEYRSVKRKPEKRLPEPSES